MAAIYDATSEKYKGNDAYSAQKNDRDIFQAEEKLMAYDPITDNFESPFEDELFTKSIVEIRKAQTKASSPIMKKSTTYER